MDALQNALKNILSWPKVLDSLQDPWLSYQYEQLTGEPLRNVVIRDIYDILSYSFAEVFNHKLFQTYKKGIYHNLELVLNNQDFHDYALLVDSLELFFFQKWKKKHLDGFHQGVFIFRSFSWKNTDHLS